MPLYEYKARHRENLAVSESTIDAPNTKEALTKLQRQGLIVLSLKENSRVLSHQTASQNRRSSSKRDKKPHTLSRNKKNSIWDIELTPQKITPQNKIFFFDQMHTLTDAGVPIIRTLEIIEIQMDNKRFARITHEIKELIQSGKSFSKSLLEYPDVFPHSWVSCVRVGEQNSQLADIFKRISENIKESHATKEAIKKALSYPLFLMFVSVFVVIFFILKVVPVFSKFFASQKQLPFVTRFVLNLSEFCKVAFIPTTIIIILIAVLHTLALKKTKYRIRFDALLLRIPLLGTIFHYNKLNTLSTYLSTMIQSGITVIEAIEISAETMNNKYLEHYVFKIRDGVKSGGSLSDQMLLHPKVFPQAFVQLVSVGEETGRLGSMLEKIASYCKQFVSSKVDVLIVLIEPTVMVFMGGVVGFLILAMFLPIFKMSQSI